MKAIIVPFQYSLPIAACLCALLAVSGSGQDPDAEPSQPRASRLTPEERQLRNQEKLKKEMEAEQQRLEIFGVVPESDSSEFAVAYRKAVEDFRRATAEFADIQSRLQLRLDPQMPDKDRFLWLEKLKNNFNKLVDLRNAAATLVLSDPVRYENVALMLREMLVTEVPADRTDHWARGARAVLSCPALVDDEVLLNAGYAGFCECDWELATNAWNQLLQKDKLPEIEQIMLRQIPEISANWAKEQERRLEDQTKDNPRVELLTSKGYMEIELFEDEAPETVASFIYLVENGYYDRKPIFLVRRHWLAQTGCEKGDGKGTAGYTVEFEANRPSFRRHYRGSLAIPLGLNTETKLIDPKTGGAQFYFSFLPLPLFDGKHTVFGRIVEGKEILGLFKEVNLTEEDQRKDTTLQPDRIIKAKVLRKRDHEYRPTPVLGKLPR